MNNAQNQNDMSNNNTFQVGNQYTNSAAILKGWPCGVYTITKRTTKSLWIAESNGTPRRVMLHTNADGTEFFSPYGSMVRAPKIFANGK